MNRISVLLELGKAGAYTGPCQISSVELAEKMDCSQQTASRWLNKLSKENLIEKNTEPRGQEIKLTSKGIELLQSIRKDLEDIFGNPPKTITLTGQIASGLGEGSYYVGRKQYREQFREKLEFDPYPGTLDISLDDQSLRSKERLSGSGGKQIEGFSTKERSFGGARAFPAEVKGERAAVVLPSRTHHEESIVEIISPVKIRDKYNLEDGDEVEVEVEI